MISTRNKYGIGTGSRDLDPTVFDTKSSSTRDLISVEEELLARDQHRFWDEHEVCRL